MLSKLITATEEHSFHFAFGQGKAFGDGSDGIQIPVPANENVSFFLIQLAEESVDYVTQCYIIYAALNIIGCRNALLQLCAEFSYKCAAFQSVAVTAAIQRNVTSDPSKERIQIASWLMRWNGVPRFHVSIVFTFFGCLLVIDYSTSQRAQATTIFFCGLFDCCFITQQI